MNRKAITRTVVVPVLLAASALTAGAGLTEGVEVFGYFEPQLAAAVLDGELVQAASNKLRFDLEAAPSDRITFGANVNFIAYHGRTAYRLADYLSDPVAAQLPPGTRDLYVLEFEDDYSLDNAFLEIAFDRFDLTVGKQQISPGTGYAWNPTDMFNRKDMLDPTYENPGHSAVAVDVPLGARGTALVLYAPEETFERSGKFARVKLHAGHFDVSLVGGERFVPLTDYLSGVASVERRRMAGGDFSGQLLDVGVWGEITYNDMATSDDFAELLVGVDHTLRSGLYLLGEFYVNGRGKCDDRDYDLNDWMRFLTAETVTVTRGQCYLHASYPATDLLTAGASAIASLCDGSFVLVPSLEYNALTDLDITVLGNLYAGGDGTAFSSSLGTGVLLRLCYYF